MRELIFFILGMFFYMLIIPFFESLITLIATAMEKPKGKMSVDIAKYNAELTKIAHEDEGGGCAIGFQLPDEIEYYDDEEEEDD